MGDTDRVMRGIMRSRMLFLPQEGEMPVLTETELFIKRHIRQDIRFLCTEVFCAVQRFINHRFCYPFSSIRGNSAYRLDIGVIGLIGVPQAAVGDLIAVGVL